MVGRVSPPGMRRSIHASHLSLGEIRRHMTKHRIRPVPTAQPGATARDKRAFCDAGRRRMRRCLPTVVVGNGRCGKTAYPFTPPIVRPAAI